MMTGITPRGAADRAVFGSALSEPGGPSHLQWRHDFPAKSDARVFRRVFTLNSASRGEHRAGIAVTWEYPRAVCPSANASPRPPQRPPRKVRLDRPPHPLRDLPPPLLRADIFRV